MTWVFGILNLLGVFVLIPFIWYLSRSLTGEGWIKDRISFWFEIMYLGTCGLLGVINAIVWFVQSPL